MANHSKTPPVATLVEWAKSMTHQQIADKIHAETGVKVARSTVSSRLSRAGETSPVRYFDTVPWKRIRTKHNNHYALTMLRLLHRRNAGEQLTYANNKRLDSWLDAMRKNQCVVVYMKDTLVGFWYVKRTQSDGNSITRVNA